VAKILIVDDDPLLVNMYKTKFELDGNMVITAGDGKEAILKARSEEPDLILLDVMMPVMDGLESLKRLKEEKETNNIPVIMLTNVSASSEEENKGLELGAVVYLVKANYTPKEVVQKVKEILSATVHELPKVKVKIKQ
jgi:DNA-binding response OmpR family regulator